MTGPVPGDWAARVHLRLMGGPWGELEVEVDPAGFDPAEIAAASPAWPCEAYGPVGLEVGAVCFIGDLGRRVCSSAAVCAEVMTDCRENIFGRLQELAAGGDLFYVELAAGFSSAADLLGGAAEALRPAELERRPPRSTVPDAEVRACRCPLVHGVIRHERETCTDPVAIRLDWFPD
jgi:hypothetical protein